MFQIIIIIIIYTVYSYSGVIIYIPVFQFELKRVLIFAPTIKVSTLVCRDFRFTGSIRVYPCPLSSLLSSELYPTKVSPLFISLTWAKD